MLLIGPTSCDFLVIFKIKKILFRQLECYEANKNKVYAFSPTIDSIRLQFMLSALFAPSLERNVFDNFHDCCPLVAGEAWDDYPSGKSDVFISSTGRLFRR